MLSISLLYIESWVHCFGESNALMQHCANTFIDNGYVSFKGNVSWHIKEKLLNRNAYCKSPIRIHLYATWNEFNVIYHNIFRIATWPYVVYCIFIWNTFSLFSFHFVDAYCKIYIGPVVAVSIHPVPFNALRLEHNGWYFSDDIFKRIVLTKNLIFPPLRTNIALPGTYKL